MRRFLLLLLLARAVSAEPRVMTPDWSLAATLTELGTPPLAAGDKKLYPLWVASPPLPAAVVDIGSRYQPNRELLAGLAMDTVVDHFFYGHLRSSYRPGLALHDVLFDGGNEAPVQSWASYVAATERLGRIVQRPGAAAAYLRRVEGDLARFGREIRAAAPAVKRFAVVQLASSRELRIFAPNSLFRVSLDLMGLEQADLGPGSRWGSKLIGLADLAQLPPDSCLLVIEPFPAMTRAELEKSYLWQRLGYGRDRCMKVLPAVWLFGGPESVYHFGRYLRESFQ